jgi:hypothetical protein
MMIPQLAVSQSEIMNLLNQYYHLFTETEGNSVFCGPETEQTTFFLNFKTAKLLNELWNFMLTRMRIAPILLLTGQ